MSIENQDTQGQLERTLKNWKGLSLRGQAKPAFEFLKMLAQSEPMKDCPIFWWLKAEAMANDQAIGPSVCLENRRN